MPHAQRSYARKIGYRTILGTDWPVHLIVFRNGHHWALAERCNGVCYMLRQFSTKAEAIAEAEEIFSNSLVAKGDL